MTRQQLTADFDDLEGQLQHMLASYPDTTLVIAGDLNSCLLRKPSRTATGAPGDMLRQLVSTYGLHICNTTAPTYRPAATLLDVLITNRRDQVIRSGVTRCHYGGPHDFSRVMLRQSKQNAKNRTVVQSRCLGRLDIESFNETLASADWYPVFTETDPTAKWNAFLHTFTPMLDEAAPLRRVRLAAPGGRTGQPGPLPRAEPPVSHCSTSGLPGPPEEQTRRGWAEPYLAGTAAYHRKQEGCGCPTECYC